jgi:hypothetical protein
MRLFTSPAWKPRIWIIGRHKQATSPDRVKAQIMGLLRDQDYPLFKYCVRKDRNCAVLLLLRLGFACTAPKGYIAACTIMHALFSLINFVNLGRYISPLFVNLDDTRL